MLDFLNTRKHQDEGPGTAETRAWLSTLADADTPAAARALIDRLVSLNRAPLQMRLRLRLLNMFSEHAAKLLPDLEQRIANAQPPVSGNTRQAAHLMEKLYKELGLGYSAIVLNAPRTWLSPGFKRQVHAPLVQAMDYQARRLALSECLYARNPRGVWQALHRLYRIACEWEIAERGAANGLTAMHLYREALLLAFARPQQLGPGDFKRVEAYLRERGHLASLEKAQHFADGSGIFLIDIRGDTPGFPYAKRGNGNDAQDRLILDTTRLVAGVRNELQQLRQIGDPVTQRNAEAGRVDLLQRLEENWRGERIPRGARSHFHPRAELWLGLGNIWRLMRESARTVPITAQGAGEWLIVNESARGFALKHVSGATPQLTVGEIVALRREGRGKLHVCVVRWIASNSPEHIEVGLQQLAPVVVPAWYQAPTDSGVGTESVLYLPTIPGPQQTALLIAPPQRINTSRTVELLHAGGRISLYATRVAESTASAEFIEVIPV
jgi:cyclic-di-GMP-binding protein